MSRPRTANYVTFFCNNFNCDTIKIIKSSAYNKYKGHYCSSVCYHKRKKSTIKLIDVCGKCEAKVSKDDQHIYNGKAVALCRVCRESRYATTLASRKKRQEAFVVKFNECSGIFCSLIYP